MPGLTPELRGLLTHLLLPPVPLLLIIICGAALLRNHRKTGRVLLTLGLVCLYLSFTEGAAQVVGLYVQHRPDALEEAQITALRKEQAEHHDVAVLVLGGGALEWVPEYGRADLKPLTLERLRYGVWLSKQLEAPLGFSGGIGWNEYDREMSEAQLAERTVADEYGLKLRWAEARSRDTRQNAAFSVPLLRDSGIHTIVLVTHAVHMKRAMRDFEVAADGAADGGAGIKLVAAPMSVRADAMSTLFDWLPSAGGYERSRYVCYELLGFWAGH
ncbi:MAG TPA: YdcF family protein [Burkholderiaceae bacterium]|jgi:uncharacterized SAM-binding protein YcdF (DUF218 family)